MEIERLAETIYQTRRRQKIEKLVTPNSDRLEDSSLILVYLFDQRPDKTFYEQLWESRAEIVNSIGRSREIFDAMSSNSVHSNYLVTGWRCERYFPTNQAVAFIAMPVNIVSGETFKLSLRNEENDFLPLVEHRSLQFINR